MANKYYTGTYSFGSTGEKQLVVDLGGDTPVGIRCIFGARANTTENNSIGSIGSSDGTRTHCYALAPGVSKKWPYTAEENYVAVAYSTGNTKQVSLKASVTDPIFEPDQVNLYCDDSNSNYQMKLEAWS